VVVGVLAAAVLASSVALFAPALPASGQQADCPPPDPYTGAQQCPRAITLSLSLQFGPAGVRVRIRAFGFNVGDPVTGTFDGVVVFTATARAGVGETAMPAQSGFAAAGLGALRSLFGQSSEAGGIDETITVPDKPVGTYPVCVSGSGGQACGEFRITATEVQGVNFTRSGGSGGGTNGGTASGVGTDNGGTKVLGRTFARTGIAVTALVLLGVSFILVGRFLRVASKRRKAHV
jgi:hypothetical protein